MPDKLKAAELLVRIRGWNEPERLNVTIDPLQSLLDSIPPAWKMDRTGPANRFGH